MDKCLRFDLDHPPCKTFGEIGANSSRNLYPHFWDLLLRAITWNIWLERNACIFTSSCSSTATIIVKISHMVLMWLNAVPDSKRAKLEESISKIKRSLEFLSTRDVELGVPSEHTSSLGDI